MAAYYRYPNAHRRDAWTVLTSFALIIVTFWTPVSHAAVTTQYMHRRAEISGGVDLRVLPIGEYVCYGHLHTLTETP